MTSRSLKLRLMAIEAIVIALALSITGFGLTYLFERHVERRISTELDTYVIQMAARLSFGPSGKPLLGGKLADPRFDNIYSGLYWQINNETRGLVAHSRSLWDTKLNLPSDQPRYGQVHIHNLKGPQGTSLLAHERRLRFKTEAGEQSVRLVVALDRGELNKMVSDFVNDTAISLLFLGGFLLLAGWVQVTIGLNPLSLIRKSIAAIRSGAATRIDTDMPREVAPLAHEVNDLLTAQEKIISRAKHRADNLAHGFKTPLTALISDIKRLRDKGEVEIADDIEAISLVMRRQIDRELTKSRIRETAKAPTIGVRWVIDGIVATLKRTPDGARKDIQIECSPGLKVPFDKDDLAEILGNLIENAVKHAADKVVVRATMDGEAVKFEIDDDGEGISIMKREMVQKRGVRLDRSVTGFGLGLAIVSDILDAYGQDLALDTSPLGGLRASFRVPRPLTRNV